MSEAELWWPVVVGGLGLAAMVAGALVAAVPPVDRAIAVVLEELDRRRSAVLAGSVLSATGAALLLVPVAAMAARAPVDGWPGLGPASLALAAVGAALLSVAALLVATVAWRDPAGADPAVARFALDAAHLLTWSVSAPVGAAATVATTIAAAQADLGGPLLVGLAVVKVATVGVELAGIGRRTGWNAGGWALGVSGYATVAWHAALLLALVP